MKGTKAFQNDDCFLGLTITMTSVTHNHLAFSYLWSICINIHSKTQLIGKFISSKNVHHWVFHPVWSEQVLAKGAALQLALEVNWGEVIKFHWIPTPLPLLLRHWRKVLQIRDMAWKIPFFWCSLRETNCSGNKLASLEATLVRNYHSLTQTGRV